MEPNGNSGRQSCFSVIPPAAIVIAMIVWLSHIYGLVAVLDAVPALIREQPNTFGALVVLIVFVAGAASAWVVSWMAFDALFARLGWK